MSKNKQASGIVNVIQYDNLGNVSIVSGSTTLMSVSSSGAVTLTNQLSGGVATSASLAQTASYVLNAVSSSYAYTASSAISSYTASSSVTSSYAFTASSADDMNVRNNLTASNAVVSGTLTAQTLIVQTITSSVEYSSGSNRFGSQLTDRQTFTGSLQVTGSTHTIYGNVTIGTATTFGKLSVYGTDDTALSSTLWGTSAGAGLVSSVYNGSLTTNSVAGIRLVTRNSGASVWNIYNVSTGNDSGDLAFGNGAGGTGTEKIRITNVGNVGINTSSPTVKLQINGQSSYEPMVLGAATGSFAVNGTTGLYGLYIASRGAGDTWMQVGRNDGTATAYNLLMQVNGGNVGIGKVSPSAKLDVAGEGRFTDMQVTGSAAAKVSIYSNYSNGNPGIALQNSSGTSNIWLNGNNASVNADVFYAVNDRNNFARGSIRLTAAGNNASTLDINVNDSITNIYSNYYSGGNDNTIIIGTYANLSNQLVLKSNGRIGIGQTNPQFTLDVNGGVRTTGLAIINNYSGTYTTDSSWTSFQNVIPSNTLNAYETYLVELNWTYASPTFAPYYASAAFLFRPVPTNATGTNNAVVLQTSCHVAGDYLITVAQQNISNQSCGGLAAKLSWSTASPSYITVTAKRIAIP